MNFLAHLWLADLTDTSLAGAVLGDIARGADLSAYPPTLEAGIRLHRRVDVATDRHPKITSLREQYGPGRRRYAGIVIDLVCDHALALDWPQYHTQPLTHFCSHAGSALAEASTWFVHAGGRAIDADDFQRLLMSYATEAGIDRALNRTANRLRNPAPLLEAGKDWRRLIEPLRSQLRSILDDVQRSAA